MLRRIMKKAHELSKGFEGDYQARLSLALKLAWKMERGDSLNELPELKGGTEKQIIWAKNIRKKMVEFLEKYVNNPRYANDTNKKIILLRKGLNYVQKQDDALWFIQNRHHNDPKYWREIKGEKKGKRLFSQ